MLEKLTLFFKEQLWRMDISEKSLWWRLLMKPLRFATLTFRCYLRDGSMLHASALTYITMLAIVPVLTLGLTSLKAFGAGEKAEAMIMENIETFVGKMNQTETAAAAPQTQPAAVPVSQPTAPVASPETPPVAEAQPALNPSQAAQAADALRNICRTVFNQIDSINFAKIGMVGAVALIFMVISVLGKIEDSFNAIWGVTKARPIWRKFTDYLSVIIIAPLLLLAATSLPVLETITTRMPNFWGLSHAIGLIGILNHFVPMIIGALLFTFLFGFLPNTRVKIPSCMLGAVVTIVILSIFFKICFVLQVGIANYSSLYGSLIALPILLFWIYSSWQIILLGAEICYVHQHRGELLRESAFTHPSHRDTIVLALALVLWAARSVEEENEALSVSKFADTFILPERDVNRVATILERSRILLPVAENGSTVTTGYVLSRCSTRLTVADVINACLDDTPGEAVIRRASDLEHLSPLTEIERRFSGVLTEHFPMTIEQALKLTPGEKA